MVKEGNVLFNDTLNTFFIYCYTALDIWYRTIQIWREEIWCCHHYMGYSFRLAARYLLYAPFTDNTAHTFVAPVVEQWLKQETADDLYTMSKCSITELHLTPRVDNHSDNDRKPAAMK